MSKRILIVGAGVAGLTSVIRLAREGIRPTIIEKAPDLRADGYLIALSHHCTRIAADLGFLDDIRARDLRVKRSRYFLGEDDCVLTLDYDRLYDPGQFPQIMRDDLQDVLFAHARDKADFRLSTWVEDIKSTKDGPVDVLFNSGRHETYDVVIGADGLHSSTRCLAMPDSDVSFRPIGLQAAAFTCENVLSMRHEYRAYMDANHHSIIYTTRQNELACIFFLKTEGEIPETPSAQLDYLGRVLRNAPKPVGTVLATRKDNPRLYIDEMAQVRLDRWHQGNVVLVGDSAHCLTQLSGIGASMAIASADCFAAAVARMDVIDAARHLERELMRQTRRLQNTTMRNARWYVPRSRGMNALRNNILRFVPEFVWAQYFRAKYIRV